MKKAIWIITALQIIITGVAVRLMPDTVPTHYDISGRIDGFGSKYTYLIMPLVTVGSVLMFAAISHSMTKKAAASKDEKKTAETVSNAKVFNIISLCTALMFGAMQCYMLWSADRAGKVGAENFEDNGLGITSLMLGIMFIVCGNFLPKTKPNGTVGLRTQYSMYNDNTWRKSNVYGGKALMLAGLLTVVTALFAKPVTAIVMLIVYTMGAVIASCVYAKKVYDEEVSLSESEKTR